MPTETTLNSLKVHKVPDFETWEENYNQANGIGTSDVVVIPPEELKKGVLPDQTNNSGKFLTTDGNGNTSWATVDALPSQSGNSGKYLKTNGSAASWENAPVTSVNSKTGAVSLSASDVNAVATSAVGANSGVAPLNASGKIDSTYLPSYVDDVIEGYYYNSKFYTTSAHTTEITGETGKIFVDLTTNKTYRYGGSSFTEISQGSVVSVSRDLTSGTKIGTLTINGTGTDLYAPTPETFTVTGGASTIVSDNLTANRALISNTNGKVAVSDVTSTELGYLDGVTSAIQTQIDGKQAKVTASGILKGDGSGGVSAATAGTDYQTPLTIDSTPTDGNTTHIVSSDGTYDKILARTKIYTASCSTGASTAAKVATLDDSSGFSLAAGVTVAVRFTYGNSATTPTLRVDGSSTGTAKTIAFSTAYNSRSTGNGSTYNTWGPYETVIFTYDGTYWVNTGSALGIYNAYNKANSITASSLGALTSESDPVFSASAAAGISSTDISTWNGKQDALPSQTNNSGKFLTTNGSALSWGTVDALPSQTNNSGKFLTTNGTSASWATVSIPTVPTMDASPTDGNSSNTVSSNGVYDMIMGRTKVYTATCSTGASTTAKVATLDDSTGFSLAAGVKVAVTFTYGNSATTPTLNVNSSGAKTIAIPSSATAYTTGNGTTYNTWGAYETVLFTYTGTYWAHDTSGYLGYLAYNTASGRQAKITASGILKGDGAGGVTAATAGTDYQAPLPSQSGNSGKYLTTNGSAMSWGTVDALPSQTGNSGKYLTTDGTNASWGDSVSGSLIDTENVSEISIDTTPTQNSTNLITSGAVYSATNEAKDVFIAEYGTTTYNEIATAIAENKNIYVNSYGPGHEAPREYGWFCFIGETLATGESEIRLGSYTPNSYREFYIDSNNQWSSSTAYVIPSTQGSILKSNNQRKVSAAVADVDYQTPLPSQSGNSGKFLTTNGSAMSWGAVDALPSQTGNSGKYLTTNGSAASWGEVSAVTEVTLDTTPTQNSTNPITSGAVYFALQTKADLASPIFTGIPIAPTATTGTNTTQIATTAFVNTELNRTNNVNAANTSYTTLMARGEKLLSSSTFDSATWSSQLVNGAIAWRYE